MTSPTDHDLQTWLSTHPRQYSKGIELYAQLPSARSFLLLLFQQGCDDYNREKLTGLLQAELDLRQAQEAARKLAYPEELTAELVEATALMDSRALLKERCRQLINDYGDQAQTERAEATLRILAIGDRLNVIYGRKRFYDRHGYFPLPPLEPATPTDLTRRINTLRTYVSRLEKELGSPGLSLKQHESAANRLARYRDELRQLTTPTDL